MFMLEEKKFSVQKNQKKSKIIEIIDELNRFIIIEIKKLFSKTIFLKNGLKKIQNRKREIKDGSIKTDSCR